jgi:hypothetical protein
MSQENILKMIEEADSEAWVKFLFCSPELRPETHMKYIINSLSHTLTDQKTAEEFLNACQEFHNTTSGFKGDMNVARYLQHTAEKWNVRLADVNPIEAEIQPLQDVAQATDVGISGEFNAPSGEIDIA